MEDWTIMGMYVDLHWHFSILSISRAFVRYQPVLISLLLDLFISPIVFSLFVACLFNSSTISLFVGIFFPVTKNLQWLGPQYLRKSITQLNSPVHGLYKIGYMKSFVPSVSRYYPISAINVTKLYPPSTLNYKNANSLYVKIHEYWRCQKYAS